MPDFTNFDPTVIAQFWIYFVFSFILGLFCGFCFCKLLFRREKAILKSEKESAESAKENAESAKTNLEVSVTNLQTQLEEKSKQLSILQNKITSNEYYWRTRMRESESSDTPGDKALAGVVHTNQ